MAPVDTSSQEWQLACLGRHICRLPGKARRHDFLNLMRKHHPAEFIAQVEQIVRTEWAIMHKKVEPAKAAHGNA